MEMVKSTKAVKWKEVTRITAKNVSAGRTYYGNVIYSLPTQEIDCIISIHSANQLAAILRDLQISHQTFTMKIDFNRNQMTLFSFGSLFEQFEYTIQLSDHASSWISVYRDAKNVEEISYPYALIKPFYFSTQLPNIKRIDWYCMRRGFYVLAIYVDAGSRIELKALTHVYLCND